MKRDFKKIGKCILSLSAIFAILYVLSSKRRKKREKYKLPRKTGLEGIEESLYDELVDFVVRRKEVSVSLIQRKFHLGYNRTLHCLDLLERNGIVGPEKGYHVRKVLINFN